MSRRLASGAVLGLLMQGAVAVSDAAPWPEVPVPPHTDVQWVAEDMEFNGTPMQLRSFRSQLSAAELLAYYRARWTSGKRCDCVENSVGPYQQIARSEGRYFYTVQVRPLDGSTSHGYIGITTAPPSRVKPGSGFPKLPGTRVVNDIRADDRDTRSRTLLMQNTHTLPANASFYERELPLEGWDAAERMPAEGIARSLRFRRAAEEATVVFSPSGSGTVVGVTVVEHRFSGDSNARTGLR